MIELLTKPRLQLSVLDELKLSAMSIAAIVVLGGIWIFILYILDRKRGGK